MAIARNASAAIGTGSGTGPTYSYTCGSGSNRLLVVGFFADVGVADAVCTSVTYNGVGMTRIGYANSDGGGDRAIWMWALANPDSGSNTLQINFSSSQGNVYVLGSDYTGADSTIPSGAVGTSAVSASSITAVGLSVGATNAWVVGLARAFGGGSVTWTAGATALNDIGNLWWADSNGGVSSGAYTLTASATNMSGIIGAAFAESGGGGGTTWPGYYAPFGFY